MFVLFKHRQPRSKHAKGPANSTSLTPPGPQLIIFSMYLQLSQSNCPALFVNTPFTTVLAASAMICSSCRRSFLSRMRSFETQSATSISVLRVAPYTTATANTASGKAPSSIIIDGPNSSQAQVSNSSGEPQEPSSMAKLHVGVTKELKKPTKLKSSVAGGQELKGLGYTKANPRIIAKEDHEYPDWLWTLLDEFKTTGDANVDTSSMSPPVGPVFCCCKGTPLLH